MIFQLKIISIRLRSQTYFKILKFFINKLKFYKNNFEIQVYRFGTFYEKTSLRPK